jgi:hypothetical protein
MHYKLFAEVEKRSVDKPPGSKEQHLSNKEDIVNAFLFSKRSWCKMSKNFLNAISCSDSFSIVDLKFSEVEASFVDVPDMQED